MSGFFAAAVFTASAAVSAVAGLSRYFMASTSTGNSGVLASALSSLFCTLAEGFSSRARR